MMLPVRASLEVGRRRAPLTELAVFSDSVALARALIILLSIRELAIADGSSLPPLLATGGTHCDALPSLAC